MKNFFTKLKSLFHSDLSHDTPSIPQDLSSSINPPAPLPVSLPSAPAAEINLFTASPMPPQNTQNVPPALTLPNDSNYTNHQPILDAIVVNLINFPELSPITQHLNQLANYPSLTSQHIEPILNQLIQLETNETSKLVQLETQLTQTSSHPLSSLQELTKTVTHINFSESPITHEDFLGHSNFSSLASVIKFGKQLTETASTLNLSEQSLAQITELLQVGSSLLDKVSTLSPAIEQFKVTEESLRTEILAFTDVITKLQSQPGLTADWNGKKDALTAKKQELDSRRESYLQEEEKINKVLATVTQNIPIILKQLKSVATTLLPLIEDHIAQTSMATNSPPTHIVSQINYIKQLLSTIKTTQQQLINCISSF